MPKVTRQDTLGRFVTYIKFNHEEPMPADLLNELYHIKDESFALDDASYVSSILDAVGVQEHHGKRYYSLRLTMMAFLEELVKYELTEENNQHKKILEDLILAMRRRTGRYYAMLLASSIVSLAIVSSILLLIPAVDSALLSLVRTIFFIPVVAMTWTAWKSYEAYNEDMIRDIFPFATRVQRNVFSTFSAAINIVAWSLLIAAGGLITPLVAGFFIAATFMLVVKEGWTVILDRFWHENQDTDEIDNPYVARRNEADINNRRNVLIIDLVISIVVLAIITVWVLLPPSILVTIPCMLALGVTYAARNVAINAQVNRENSFLREDFDRYERMELQGRRVEDVLVHNNSLKAGSCRERSRGWRFFDYNQEQDDNSDSQLGQRSDADRNVLTHKK